MANAPGRPSAYTLELAEEICERLSRGEPLAQICRDDHMPTDRTVRNWQGADAAFSSAIACARETGFDVIATQCLDIADETGNDTIVGEDGKERPDTEWISRSKLRIETRLKLLSKWDPKRYGDRVAVDHGGAIGITISPDDAEL